MCSIYRDTRVRILDFVLFIMHPKGNTVGTLVKNDSLCKIYSFAYHAYGPSNLALSKLRMRLRRLVFEAQ